MIKEFKDFIIKGNAIDLAVGVLIGAAFGGVVKAFTDGIVNPILQAIGGKPDIVLKLWIFDIGLLINAFISLVLTGAILFFVFIKPMKKIQSLGEKPAEPETPPEPSTEEKLLTEIRDLLRQKN